MKLESYGSTDIGRMRRRNEDAFYEDPEHRLFAVADGLGGLTGGDRASQLAISILKAHQQEAARKRRSPDFPQIFLDAHHAIQKMGAQLDPIRGAGTTLTVALVADGEIRLAHVGDSAAYLLRSGEWKKLTTDHTEAEIFRNQYPGEDVPPAFEHTLTRCLGQPGAIEPDLSGESWASGDRLLLCTDGVTRDISPEEIGQWIQEHDTPRSLVEEVIRVANRRGGGDNLTAVAVYFK